MPGQKTRSFALLTALAVAFASAAAAQDAPQPASETAAVSKSHPAQGAITKAVEELRNSRHAESLKILVEACAQHPDLPPGEILFAHLCFAANQIEPARQAIERAAVNHPQDPEVWNMLADLALRSQRLAESEVLFQKALTLAKAFSANEARQQKQLVNAEAGLATVYQRRGQWDQAENHLRSWIERDQKNTGAWRRLATVFFLSQRYDLAQETLEQLRGIDPRQLPAEVAMSLMYQKSGQFEKAASLMKTAVTNNGEDFATRMAAAQWALTMGDQQMLNDCIAKGAELQPKAPAVDALRGMAARFAGKPEQAEQIFQQMLNLNPASFDASNGLALAQLEQNDQNKHRQAIQHAQVNVQRHSDQRTARGRAAAATFAWALHRMGNSAEAEKVIQAVITSGEISPEVGYFASEILRARGRNKLATELLQKSVASSVAFPQKPAAQEVLQQLQENG
jgi:tetratricopeptide (TPR) repeat protein